MNRRFNAVAIRTLVTVVLLTMCFGSMTANAQILYGSVTGTVTDLTGAVIPGAAVTLTNQGTGAARATTANEGGTYLLLDVLPGVYTVTVPAKGNFAGTSVRDIQIEVNRQVRVDITLRPASVSTQVTVTEAQPLLQTENAEVNSEINQTQLTQMPMTSSQGRNFESLYTLVPGGANVREQNSTGSNPSRAMSVNVNGINMNGNTTRIDGAVNYYGYLPYLIAYVPPADSIENVSITTNDFNAEQGQAGGASIKITTKSGTHDFHGSAWEYYQDAAMNARPYTTTAKVSATLPKNIFQEYGGNIGGPVYLPKILTGKKKLFFFDNWERTTRRQLISGLQTVPDSNMILGNFSEVPTTITSGSKTYDSHIYDPQPQVTGWESQVSPTLCPVVTPGFTGLGPDDPGNSTAGYVNFNCRPSFTAEYGETGNNVNTIPTGRQSTAAQTMIANLSTIAASIGTPTSTQLNNQFANDYFGAASGTYNRTSNDAKITYIPSENTQIFGKYSVEPFQVNDPQELGPAGGGTFDGGQPGAGHGRIQNVGLGASHVISPKLVVDADFGYTRQWSGAQSTLDLSLGDYGLNTLHIPGTNLGTNDPDYFGQPAFSFNSTFSSIGNSNTGNPFIFRDNQFTGDVNLSYVKGKHQVKGGFTYYHFDLNHFQPANNGGVQNARGGFLFAGGMTCGGASTCAGAPAYTSLADMLLGLPNGTNSIAKSQQTFDPNALRWTEFGAYAQDQWTVNPKLSLSYGVRYERYPVAYRDHTGIYVFRPDRTLAQGNIEVGGVNGLPENAGVIVGPGFFAPRAGIVYRLDEKTVIRTGAGITVDPDSMRYLRDSFPMDLVPSYSSNNGAGTIDTDNANGNVAMPLTYGIPIPAVPNYSSGFATLPITQGTNTIPLNFRRGYIESWNLFVQREVGKQFVANIGYVGNLFVREMAGVQPYNAAPLPSASTPCMANGQVNPSTGLNPTGTGLPCSSGSIGGFAINEIINAANCSANTSLTPSNKNNLACYNTGGITVNTPIFSADYNALQAQLTRNAGQNLSVGAVYTYGHAFDYEDNGAGTGQEGTKFNYPAYYKMNRASSGFDVKHNVQVWSVYSLPFGHGQKWANHGIADEIVGGFHLNGQYSYFGGQPFSVTAASSITYNAPGTTVYAQLIAPYQKYGGHERTPGDFGVSGGKPWFNPASFANPVVLQADITHNPNNVSPVFANTHRNEFRGPGTSVFNASLFKGFHVYRESEFQIRFEAFNLFNHALLNNPSNNPNSQVGGGSFGYITSFGPYNSQTQGARSLQFGGRYNF
ncbi:MAG: carboxypeptidase regulatory-like domain-containing protein [Terracidiphilus sp.]